MASGWWKSTHANLALGSPVDFAVTTGPAAPRGFPKLASIATGAGLFLGGTPSLTLNGSIYYAGDDYVQDTDKPYVARWDGRVSTTIIEIPHVSATPSKAILSMVTDDNGVIYISTWDSGTTSSNFAGRVFALSNGTLTQIDGGLFTAGKLPYGLAWLSNVLYVGTTNQDPATAGVVYRLDTTVTAPVPTYGPTPTVTKTGTTTYTYRVGALNGPTSSGTYIDNSTDVSCFNGATLNGTYYNNLSWSSPVGSVSYRVKRMAGPDPGVIASIEDVGTTTLTDNGITAFAASFDIMSPSMSLTVTPVPAQATTNTYYVTAVIGGIEYRGAASGSSATCPATLTSDVYANISWSAVTGATSYKIYRTAGHSSTGLIGTTASTSFNDTGIAGNSAATPSVKYSNYLGETTLTAGGTGAILPFGTSIYVGAYMASGTFGKVYKIDSSYTLTTSTTAAPGGTAQSYNGFTAMVEFESNLYAAYWNDDATDVTLILKFNGSSWSTVKTISGAGARPIMMFSVYDGTCYAYGGGDAKTGILYSSADGTTWTDISTLLPTSKEAIPFMGTVDVIGGF